VNNNSNVGVRDFIGINTNTNAAETFNSCRICDRMTAAECAQQSLTVCYPVQDNETDNRVCMLQYEQRLQRDGSIKTLYTSRCAIPSTCEAAVRQNFAASDPRHNQCKRSTTLSRRYEQSNCSFCQKLSHETGLGNTDIFQTAAEPFEGVTEAALTADPAAKGTWSAVNPLGQLFADGTYTYTVS
jgi:hypothetical protein